MTIEVKVPALPESVADAVVLTWHKKPGDLVKRDESLVDVETDKVVLEVPAPVDGVLSDITQQEGATVVSDQVLAVMQEGNVSEQAAAEEAVTSKESNDEKAAPVISPSAKKMLIENDIDEKSVTGTGRDGRILKEDIINYL
ncbi:MAG: E3 binding domain-containing protein, partial [Gammaproteobacteria bacterium]|nr:E3 binding domain-containing protein [Gammaproteobacteria bacterium]